MTTLPRPTDPPTALSRSPEPSSGLKGVEPEPTEAELEEEVMQPGPVAARHPVALSFKDRVEAFIARLSTRNHFWHRVCSMIWLPYAFRSGIRMKRVDATTFSAVLPFRRFN